MTTPPSDLHPDFDPDRDLHLSLHLAAPRALVWRCWTTGPLLQRWFTPAPWSTAKAEVDVRPGGAQLFVMKSPDGEEHPNRGTYLEVVPQRRLVSTDAFTEGWALSAKPFMTTIIDLFDADDGGTHYHALARHWSAEDRTAHEDMGFLGGWTAAARQLEALAQSL